MWRITSTLVCLMLLVSACGACTSPEASRARGGGAGGDVGNRDAVVEMHAGSQPYYHTPCQLPLDCHGMAGTSGGTKQGLPGMARDKEPYHARGNN